MTLDELKEQLNEELDEANEKLELANEAYQQTVAGINATFQKIAEYESLKAETATLIAEWHAIYDSDVVFNLINSNKKFVYFLPYNNLKAKLTEKTNPSYTVENRDPQIPTIQLIPNVTSEYYKSIEPEIKIMVLNVRYDIITLYESRIEELRIELGIDPENKNSLGKKGKDFKKL